MKTRGRFVENKQRWFLLLLSDKVGQLYTLVFSTRERRRVLSKFYVTQAYILKSLQALNDCSIAMFLEELDSLGDGHVQDIINILSVIVYIENLFLKTVSMTCLTLKHQVGHELHLYSNYTCTLTFFASSAIGIKREVLWGESHLF